MSDSNTEGTPVEQVQLEGGTYEVIRRRLLNQCEELELRLDKLNELRKQVFGSIEQILKATERISTDNNCIARDMFPIGKKRFIFGFNVQLGLRSETSVEDVFEIYSCRDHKFSRETLDPLKNDEFFNDFKSLYKYYKTTVFNRFFSLGPYVYMVFNTGRSENDIKTFKWLLKDDELTYINNRSDHEVVYPPQHEFEWVRAHRDMHRGGSNPHISIEDRVFVEAIGGDITFKIEDNTDVGHGIYAEPVDHLDQTLDDAEILYASVGNIILVKIKPYQENEFRYYLFNEKVKEVKRVDDVEDACVLLPDDHGLIFFNGYYLQTGELKKFDHKQEEMVFYKKIRSSNGEDFLYVFHNRVSGEYILLSYNLINRTVATPMVCHGYSIFKNGEQALFRRSDNPTKNHSIQIWQTPYINDEFVQPGDSNSYLYKIGNAEIVSAMAACREILTLTSKESKYEGLYSDIVKKCAELINSYHWIEHEDASNLKEVLVHVKEASTSAIDEFEKVLQIKENTNKSLEEASIKTKEALSALRSEAMDSMPVFVKHLAKLRELRGQIISLNELRYIDSSQVETLSESVATEMESLSASCVEYLLKDNSLDSYISEISEINQEIPELTKITLAKECSEKVQQTSDELEMLLEIVSNLKIDDSTKTTKIIDSISDIFSDLNGLREKLKKKTKSLLSTEGLAEFNAQMKLLSQSVLNYMEMSDTPDKCDEYLSKTMLQIEECEGKFADFDDFILKITEKRDNIYNAFESKKLQLVEKRNRQTQSLQQACERILKGVSNRINKLKDINAINGTFASDLMIDKIRDIVKQLRDLDDSVKADDIEGKLKSLKEEAVRQLKDRQELFEDGEDIIKFGVHKFSVNKQVLDLTAVRHDEGMALHLTGTGFFEAMTDERLLETKPVWEMDVISENDEVYRGEYLAYQLLLQFEREPLVKRKELLENKGDIVLEYVQHFMAPLFEEGYSKGVHDIDSTKLFFNALKIREGIGLLRFHPKARTLAILYWERVLDKPTKEILASKIKGYSMLNVLFTGHDLEKGIIPKLKEGLVLFVEKTDLFSVDDVDEAARYLFYQKMEGDRYSISKESSLIYESFQELLKVNALKEKLWTSIEGMEGQCLHEYELVCDWLKIFLSDSSKNELLPFVDETASLMVCKVFDTLHVNSQLSEVSIEGLVGHHDSLTDKNYHLQYNAFESKLRSFSNKVVPLYKQFTETKKDLLHEARVRLRLEEFKPRILSSFVRNQLIDKVYLPLIGDNLAKQIGVIGENKRTDLMGMLLLISPPGYGKTTLMEYLSDRLGIIFMKINGPALGHDVTSLDPQEAPNAGAREEVNKLNLALEMGDNVMIYLDDIQHCNPEFLQKFISLCDGQRKIEGVYRGVPKTYDLRGKKVVVVMAGNPYTESGEKFKIPDMLTNRADTYNLGDIIGDKIEYFKNSYLENSLTSNAIMNRLASKSKSDVYAIFKMAETDVKTDLDGNYSSQEVNEMISVAKKMIKVRDIILEVNKQYIVSAGQSDDYRTEPAFKLQGSYRNMNRITEKIIPVMNEKELLSIIISDYENESQTLTSGAESNMLKFKELNNLLTEDEKVRWEEIKKTFNKNQLFSKADKDDPISQVVVQLSSFTDGLDSIHQILKAGLETKLESMKQTPAALEVVLPNFNETLRPLIKALEDLKLSSNDSPGLNSDLLENLLTKVGEVNQSSERQEPSANITVSSDEDEAPQVEIINRIPSSIYRIIDKQFKVMSTWVRPFLKSELAQQKEYRELTKAINNLLYLYGSSIEKMSNLPVNDHEGKTLKEIPGYQKPRKKPGTKDK